MAEISQQHLQTTSFLNKLETEINCLLGLAPDNLLTEGLNNWKLRLILSALLCIFGLAALVSMSLGLFVSLNVYDKSLVCVAIFIVGVPAYLILSNLASIDEKAIAGFLNNSLPDLEEDPQLLIKPLEKLTDTEKEARQRLETFFSENPVYQYLPTKPVAQAYLLFLVSVCASFAIWFFG